jgi:hypothetical protein
MKGVGRGRGGRKKEFGEKAEDRDYDPPRVTGATVQGRAERARRRTGDVGPGAYVEDESQ